MGSAFTKASGPTSLINSMVSARIRGGIRGGIRVSVKDPSISG